MPFRRDASLLAGVRAEPIAAAAARRSFSVADFVARLFPAIVLPLAYHIANDRDM
jgi:hypothetical protein